MGKRETDPRLQALYDAGIKPYSFSRLGTINQCEFQAFLAYIKKIKGTNNIYGIMGGRIHDVLEDIMENKATEKDLYPAFLKELEDAELLGIDFPKDRKGENSIRDNWIADMTHFCNNFVKPEGKFITEELFIYKISETRYIIGYIDLIRINKDGTLYIIDWKSSSNFETKKILEYGRQLILYGMGKEQQGEKVRDLSWVMLKYCEVKFLGKAKINSKNKTDLVKVVNRGKLIKELRTHIELDLKDMGYNEVEIDLMMVKAISDNSFDSLPKEISDLYHIRPYVRIYDFTEELQQETLDYINTTADYFESKDPENEDDWKPLCFVDKKGNPDTFFCDVLCDYGNICKHLKEFKETYKESKREEQDLFA